MKYGVSRQHVNHKKNPVAPGNYAASPTKTRFFREISDLGRKTAVQTVENESWGRNDAGRQSGVRCIRAGPQPSLTVTGVYGTAGRSEAQVIEPALGREPGAERRPAEPNVVVPAAAAKHTERALGRTLWILQRRGPVVARIEPVHAPFPDVPVHVMHPKTIRSVRTYSRGTPPYVVEVRLIIQ